MNNTENAQLLPWVAPVIESLEIEETNGFPRRGADPSRYADCTNS